MIVNVRGIPSERLVGPFVTVHFYVRALPQDQRKSAEFVLTLQLQDLQVLLQVAYMKRFVFHFFAGFQHIRLDRKDIEDGLGTSA